MAAQETPQFAHDCEDGCKFLGRYVVSGENFDTYLHKSEDYVSVVLRYGSEGEEYQSFPASVLARTIPANAVMKLACALYLENY